MQHRIEVVDALEIVGIHGSTWLDRGVLVRLATACADAGAVLDVRLPVTDPLASLTAREREVASLVATGASNSRIARTLRVSVATVKDHVHHALTKTGCSNRTELAAMVLASASH